MKDEENMPAGHRERLINTVFKCGLENVSEIQAVEFVLFYVFPRGDVNPLAHRLIDRYKHFSSMLEAPIEDLQMVKGMGEMSAKKLHLFLSIYSNFIMDKLKKQKVLSTAGEMFDYIESLLRFKNEEEFHLLGLDANGGVIEDRCLAKGSIKRVGIEMRDISLFVSTYHVHAVIFVHNHPNGSCVASAQDIVSNEKLEGMFKFSGARMVDNLIVGEDGIYSIPLKQIRRKFLTSEEYCNLSFKDSDT